MLLSARERKVILRYTETLYHELNRVLRNREEMSPWLRKCFVDLASGLSRLPPFTGICYRGASIYSRSLERYYSSFRSAAAITERAFLSASLSYDIAINHMDNVMFKIYSKRGRYIAEYSSYPDEKEVLFIASSRFTITMIKDYGAESVFVIMYEL